MLRPVPETPALEQGETCPLGAYDSLLGLDEGHLLAMAAGKTRRDIASELMFLARAEGTDLAGQYRASRRASAF